MPSSAWERQCSLFSRRSRCTTAPKFSSALQSRDGTACRNPGRCLRWGGGVTWSFSVSQPRLVLAVPVDAFLALLALALLLLAPATAAFCSAANDLQARKVASEPSSSLFLSLEEPALRSTA